MGCAGDVRGGPVTRKEPTWQDMKVDRRWDDPWSCGDYQTSAEVLVSVAAQARR